MATPTDREDVHFLDQRHRQARTARARLEPVWYLNLAYFVGEQWLAWDGRQLYRPTLRPNRITIVDNRIQPAVRREVAKLTKNRPVFVVDPNTGNEDDAAAAQLGESLVEFLWPHLHLDGKVIRALEWSRITGAGFLKVMWDPTIGTKRDVYLGQAGKIVTDSQGQPVRPDDVPDLPNVQRKTVGQGDVRVEVRSPFQMFVDPLADDFSEAEWCIEESIKSHDYVKQRYGVSLEPDTPANPGMIEARMGAVFMPGTGGYKGLKVREYWERPCEKWPNGFRAVWCQQQLLFADDNPFDAWPYVMLSGIPVPGRLWPTSVVEQLRGTQTWRNKTLSQLSENASRVGNPSVLASKQSIQDPERFAQSMTMPGGIIFYDDVGSPNAVPSFLQAPPMPDYVSTMVELADASFQEISGQHEVASAQVPPGVTAASAINLLQEADDTMLGPVSRDFENQIGWLGTKVLKHVEKFYTDQRIIRIAGDNGAWQIFPFRGAQLKGNTTVRVEAGSAFPQSKAAKQAALTDLLRMMSQSGNPLQGKQLAQFLQDWEIGGANRLIAQYTQNETQINGENLKLAQGQALQINSYDNDADHIDGHQEHQRGPQYQSYPPQVKQLFEQHVDLHQQRQAQQQQTQLQMQLEIEGRLPPNLTAPAVANAQQLGQGLDEQHFQDANAANLQFQGAEQQMNFAGQQQQHAIQGAQARQQLTGQAEQQGYQAAAQQQQQRHAEELHQSQLQQVADQRRQAEEQHQAKLYQMRQQANQRQQQGQKPSGGR